MVHLTTHWPNKLWFIIGLLLALSLTASTVTVQAARPGPNNQPSPSLILQLAPEANLKAVVQTLSAFKADGQIGHVQPGSGNQLRLTADPDMVSQLRHIPGVKQVISLTPVPQAGALTAQQATETLPQAYWLQLTPDAIGPPLITELANRLVDLQTAGLIQQFEPTDQPTIWQVIASPEAEAELAALPGVLLVTDNLDSLDPTPTRQPTSEPQPTDEPTAVPTPGEVAAITGMVTDEATGDPLANIKVCALPHWDWAWPHPEPCSARLGGCYPGSTSSTFPSPDHDSPNLPPEWALTLPCTVTDEAGNYTLYDLPPHDYLVAFWDSSGDYIHQFYDNQPTLFTADPVTVTAESPVELAAALSQGGQISGTIWTTDDEPLPGVIVELYRQTPSGWQWAGIAETTEAGQYAIGGLTAGTYRVRASGRLPQVEQFEQFYQQATSLDEATDIVLTAGQTETAIDFLISLPNGQVSGQVTNTEGLPLAEITVEVYRQKHGRWRPIAKATTDAEGQYTVNRLAAGSYRVRFVDWAGRYRPQFYDQAPDLAQASDVIVTADSITSDINATLLTGGIISGQVTNTAGRPIAQAEVCAMPAIQPRPDGEIDPDIRPPDEDGRCAETNQEGRYEITGLESGDYVVHFLGQPDIYISEFYNDQSSWSEADPVTVVVGQRTAGVDAVLSSGSLLSGLVTDQATGKALADMWVCVTPRHRHGERQCGTTDTNGGYLIAGLRPGQYLVEFWDPSGTYQPQFYDHQPSQETATPVIIEADQTIGGINAALSTGGHITGQVTDGAGTALADITIEVYGGHNNPADDHDDAVWRWRGLAQTDETGQYEIGGLPSGQYRVGFFDWSGQYIPQYYDNAPTLETATAVTVTLGDTTPNIDAVLAQSGGFTGQVTSEAGDSLAGISVTAYQFRETSWQPLASGYSNEAGEYEVYGLPSGTYRVEFADWSDVALPEPDLPIVDDIVDHRRPLYATEYYDDASDLASATDINVTAGQMTPNINASLMEGGHITGSVTTSEGEPLPQVQVEVFRQQDEEWIWAGMAVTNRQGEYDVAGLNTGTYRLGFFDWSHRQSYIYYPNAVSLEMATDIAVTAGQTTANINVTLTQPVTPVVDVELEHGRLVINPLTGEVTVIQLEGHRGDVTLFAENNCPAGQPPASELVLLMNNTTYPFVEVKPDSGRYQVTLPATDLVDGAVLKLLVTCEALSQTQPVGQVMVVHFDPSGLVTDAETDLPIAGAKVTLYAVPDWQPKTSASDNRPNTCESAQSTESAAHWSQPAPTDLGVMVDLTGDDHGVAIEPPFNPFITEADGLYGWTVPSGCWYVVVEAAGYVTLTSPVVGVPPAVTDLNLALTPLDEAPNLDNPEDRSTIPVYLPIVVR